MSAHYFSSASARRSAEQIVRHYRAKNLFGVTLKNRLRSHAKVLRAMDPLVATMLRAEAGKIGRERVGSRYLRKMPLKRVAGAH